MKLRMAVLIFFLGTVLTAQITRNLTIPLKNWAAPQYWQPTQAENVSAQAGLNPAVRTGSINASTLPPALVFVAMTPCRVVDTRVASAFPSPFGTPALVANTSRPFPIQSSTLCPIPAAAQAYSFNVTVIPNPLGTPVGYLTIWPQGLSQPNVVTLDDYPTGDIRNNAAIVPAGAPSGGVSVIAGAATDLVVDVNGYFAAPTDVNSNTGLGLSALSSNTTGYANTAVGSSALSSNSSGYANTASGWQALLSNAGGFGNTGFGSQALQTNISGNGNTAVGDSALVFNTASNNTATGYGALYTNSDGFDNTATGYYALRVNDHGYANTANGFQALLSNAGGFGNTGFGSQALQTNSVGYGNTAVGDSALVFNLQNLNSAYGYGALYHNTSGYDNTGVGTEALHENTGGFLNTALGFEAGYYTTGSNNTALGFQAGYNITGGGNNNIMIGTKGITSDNNAIRIGTIGTQATFFAAGVYNAQPFGSAVNVVIDGNGQLGTISSSRRYKEDIQDMSEASDGLLRLRPVTFRYQRSYGDGSKPRDYGLIAEEVAEIYPDLVVRGKDGQIETVQYQKLTPMLLNELQKQNQTAQLQQAQISALQKEHEALQKALEILMSDKMQTVRKEAEQR